MEGDAVATRPVGDIVEIACERCDAEEFLGFRECRSCARLLDPRRTHAADTPSTPQRPD
jgi:hypothetical protein